MTLHRKAVLVVAIASIVVALATLVVARGMLIPGLLRYEEHLMGQRLETLGAALDHVLADLDRTAMDYATWDRTYAFMLRPSRNYKQSAFSEMAFQNYHIQLVTLIGLDDAVMLERTFLTPGAEPVDAADARAIEATAREFMPTIRDEVALQGLIATPRHTFFVVIRPILNGRGMGPARGMLVMARRIDDDELQLMGDIIHAPVSMQGGEGLTEKSTAATELKLRSGADAWFSAEKNEAVGHILLRDLNGKAAILLKVKTDRALYQSSRRLIWSAAGLVASLALVLGLGKLWFLRRLILRRVHQALKLVERITAGNDLSIRVPVTVKDELGVLATCFNDMLDELERSRNELLSIHYAVEFEAMHDVLTGLKNRRAILMTLQTELTRGAREGTTLAVFLADIDHFKQINDRYGHAVGDTVLTAVAAAMDSELRPYDAAGRYGGEEFLIVVPAVNHVQAMEVADRLRRNVEQTVRIEEAGGQPVTVSIGVAVTSGDMTLEALIAAADASMYAAKRAGRNRVEMVMPRSADSVPSAAREYSDA